MELTKEEKKELRIRNLIDTIYVVSSAIGVFAIGVIVGNNIKK